MKILIIGRGHLGSFLANFFDGVDQVVWHKGQMADVTVEAIRKSRCEAIVNTAAKTDIDWCQANPIEAWHNNVVEPLALFKRAQNALPMYGKFIQISSGCVWDGPYHSNGQPFQPDDAVSPACFYTWSKAACDALLLREARSTRLAIVRFRQLFSHMMEFERNTLRKLVSYESLHDNPNSMCSAETVGRAIRAICDDRFSLPRVLNVYDLGVYSPFRVARMLNQKGLRGVPKLSMKDELDSQPRTRRVDTVLKDDSFESVVHPRGVDQELISVINTIVETNKAQAQKPG